MTLHIRLPLTHEEYASLKKLGQALSQKKIPDEHLAKLIQMGFAEQRSGGTVLTANGVLRVSQGR